jgi:arylformamidase
MLEIIDITPPVDETLVRWPGLTPTSLRRAQSMDRGDAVNVTDCSFCAHVGLHVDAPCHHIAGGIGTDQLSLGGMMGEGYVMDLTHVDTCIDVQDLAPLCDAGSFDVLLMKTKNSTEKTTWEKFDETLVYLTPEAGQAIIDRGVKGLVVDCLTVEKYGSGTCPTHKALLKDNRIAVIEGADLRHVAPGLYWFACLPVKLVGADGAPARAVLVRDTEGSWLDEWRKAEKRFLR